MHDDERRDLIRRYWESSASGEDLSDEIYHDDAVLEFPQSGERFERLANFREWRNEYPASVRLEMRELRGEETCGSWRGPSAMTAARGNPP